MYVDNELLPAERALVEDFAQQHPDLAEELSLFKEAVLMPDNKTTLDKGFLLKNEQSINQSNYEEYFLLHIDGELDGAGREDVEKFVLQHPHLQAEFTQLQQTVLAPELIKFNDKESLYRSEARVKRMLPLAWMRIAAAAVFIGVIALLWMDKPVPDAVEQPIASLPLNPITKALPPSPRQFVTPPQHETNNENTASASRQPVPKKAIAIPDVQHTSPPVQQPVRALDNGNLNDLPSGENNPVIAAIKHNRDAGIQPAENSVQSTLETGTKTAGGFVKDKATVEAAINIHQVVYKEIDTEDNDHIIFIGSAEINKQKLRGLFKKASTLFERKFRKNESDDALHISSFEIKTN